MILVLRDVMTYHFVEVDPQDDTIAGFRYGSNESFRSALDDVRRRTEALIVDAKNFASGVCEEPDLSLACLYDEHPRVEGAFNGRQSETRTQIDDRDHTSANLHHAGHVGGSARDASGSRERLHLNDFGSRKGIVGVA
jgi:hypothetical protein